MLKLKPHRRGKVINFDVFLHKQKIGTVTTCSNRGGQSAFTTSIVSGKYSSIQAVEEAIQRYLDTGTP